MKYLTEQAIHQFIQSAILEDIGSGDHSTLSSVPATAMSKAKLLIKDDGIIAGIELAKLIFRYVDENLQITTYIKDGEWVTKGAIAFIVEGKAQSILQAERLVLNCMQRMSGIATYTYQLVSLIEHTETKLLDTRKTTPNFRIMEKWAVKIGGGENHRFGLYDMIMLKDNHIDYAGGIEKALNATFEYLEKNKLNLEIVVETRNLDEVQQVLEIGKIRRILLDNMNPPILRKAVELIGGRFETEASGGITEQTIKEIAETGVTYISVGALTHSFKSLDMSLKAF